MEKWVFCDDQFVSSEKAKLHYSDLAIQRGYGVFDFFKIVNGYPVFLEDHLNRFFHSANNLRLSIKFTKEELSAIILQLIQRNSSEFNGIRITLTGGYSPDGYSLTTPNLIVSVHSFLPFSKDDFSKGTRLMSYDHQRQLPRVKSIDYLMAVWLQSLVTEKAANDVLYHDRGFITECPRANFFMVSAEGRLITPKNKILNGITREKVLSVAKDHFTVEEREIHLDELKMAKEAFITSTTKSIMPVRQIDDHVLPVSNPVTARIFELYAELQQKHLLALEQGLLSVK
jgi:D-alanine transaminase/branched-chain amino acid aminotransferase